MHHLLKLSDLALFVAVIPAVAPVLRQEYLPQGVGRGAILACHMIYDYTDAALLWTGENLSKAIEFLVRYSIPPSNKKVTWVQPVVKRFSKRMA